jgi:hypothetical protein
MNSLKLIESLPLSAPVQTVLATQDENAQIILAFSDLTNIGNVDKLTDENLFKHMKHGLRLTGQLLQPFCASFLRRFKQAKKETGSFHGFKEFDRAARAKTGYTGQQVRNLAAGTPTPVKKATVKPLTAAEKKFRADTQALQEKVDAAVTAKLHARLLSGIESHGDIQIAGIENGLPAVESQALTLADSLVRCIFSSASIEEIRERAEEYLATRPFDTVPPHERPAYVNNYEPSQAKPNAHGKTFGVKREADAVRVIISDGKSFPMKDKQGIITGYFPEGTRLLSRTFSEPAPAAYSPLAPPNPISQPMAVI